MLYHTVSGQRPFSQGHDHNSGLDVGLHDTILENMQQSWLAVCFAFCENASTQPTFTTPFFYSWILSRRSEVLPREREGEYPVVVNRHLIVQVQHRLIIVDALKL